MEYFLRFDFLFPLYATEQIKENNQTINSKHSNKIQQNYIPIPNKSSCPNDIIVQKLPQQQFKRDFKIEQIQNQNSYFLEFEKAKFMKIQENNRVELVDSLPPTSDPVSQLINQEKSLEQLTDCSEKSTQPSKQLIPFQKINIQNSKSQFNIKNRVITLISITKIAIFKTAIIVYQSSKQISNKIQIILDQKCPKVLYQKTKIKQFIKYSNYFQKTITQKQNPQKNLQEKSQIKANQPDKKIKNEEQKLFTDKKLRKKILLGQTAVGKTSLLNFYFNTKYHVGMGDCTSQIIEVKQISSIKIYDSYPLQVSQFYDYSAQQYEQFIKYDEIYFLYCTSLKNISKVISKIVELKGSSKNIYFLRTKCDNFDDKQLRTYTQEIQVDKNLLIEWGLKSDQISIYGVSSKNKDLKAFDNNKVYKLLTK